MVDNEARFWLDRNMQTQPIPVFFVGESVEVERQNKILCDGLLAHLNVCCDIANKHFQAGQTLTGRYWSDRAQNIRRVLVDYEVLPPTSL